MINARKSPPTPVNCFPTSKHGGAPPARVAFCLWFLLVTAGFFSARCGGSPREDRFIRDPRFGKLDTRGWESQWARFLAGKPLTAKKEEKTTSPEGKKKEQTLSGKTPAWQADLRALSKTTAYQKYRRNLDQFWKNNAGPNLRKMATWWQKQYQKHPGGTLLYPFSGPDILNAINLFPDRQTYILLALETPGRLTSPENLKAWRSNPDQLAGQLIGLQASLREIVRYNFFFTRRMRVRFDHQSLSGLATLYSLFLARQDWEVLRLRRLLLTPGGKVRVATRLDPPEKAFAVPATIDWRDSHRREQAQPVAGFQILARDTGGKIRQILYLQANLADVSFYSGKPIYDFLNRFQGQTTFLKAASYLMYRSTFDNIRFLLLKNSRRLVQDSSGIPYHYLSGPFWRARLFGHYSRPIPLFRNFCQPDLRQLSGRGGQEKLPFRFGYTSSGGPGKTHLLVADRRLAMDLTRKFHPDQGGGKGETTRCRGNELILRSDFGS